MKQEKLLDTIEQYLAKNAIKASTFGREAMNDPKFVYSLRNGRRVWPETIDRVLAYISNS